MKVLLIHLPFYQGQRWSLPLGLAYIAAVLLKAGCGVDVLDINLLIKKRQYSTEVLKHKLKTTKYLFIGFGGVFFDFTFFRNLSAMIKKTYPNTYQVIGGQWASRIAEVLVNNTDVDSVVMGEGEEIILQISDSLSTGRSVGKLQYVHVKNKPCLNEFATVKDLDRIPFPARELFDMRHHRLEIRVPDPLLYYSTIIATRGCPRRCVFCSPIGGVIRTRSPENIIQEMKELNEKYGVKYFRFNDEVFLGSNEKVIAFCDALEKSRLKIIFSIWGFSETLDEKVIRRLKDVQCNRIELGIENGSPQILKEMNKIQNLERVKKTVKIMSDNGLSCGSGFLTGTPGETIMTLEENKRYIKELNKIRNFTIPKINLIKLLIGTPIYNLAKGKRLITSELEFIIDSDKNQMFRYFNLTGLDENEYFARLRTMNNELRWDYYSRCKIRLIKRLFLANEIDYVNLVKNISLKDIPAITRKVSFILRDNFYSLLFKLKFLRKIIDFQSLGLSDRL